MKKLFLFIVLFILANVTFAQLQTIWERKAADNTLYSWFGNNNEERGFAYGYIGGNHRLYVVDRTDNTIKILNAETGAEVGSLPTNSITGFCDIECTSDGKIIATKLVTSAGTYEIYKWDNETSNPTVIGSVTTISPFIRFGDKISAYGSFDAGTLTVYTVAANNSGSLPYNTKAYKWTQSSAGGNLTANEITLNLSGSSNPNSAQIAIINSTNDTLYMNAGGYPAAAYKISTLPTRGDEIPTTVLATGQNAIKAISYGGNRFIITAGGSSDKFAKIINVSKGMVDATIYANTPALGTNSNVNGTADVAVRYISDGVFDIYVLITNNGIGCYRTTAAPLPVELGTFNYLILDKCIKLYWNTKSEINAEKFVIQRKRSDDVTDSWLNIGELRAAGNSNIENKYEFVDSRLSSGKYLYRLKQVDFDGKVNYSDEIEVDFYNTKTIELLQNYPNPFNPATNIYYTLPEKTTISIKVYDIKGSLVATLFEGEKEAGNHIIGFNANNLPTGTYICKLQSGNTVKTMKMMLMK